MNEEKFCCTVCGKWISKEEYESYKSLCRRCHMKIHMRHKKYPNLAPKKPPDWKFPQIIDSNMPEFLRLEENE